MAKKKAKKNKARFVVGYPYLHCRTIWGRDNFRDDQHDYCHTMTEHQARQNVKKMPDKKATIFELVPVE